MPVNLWEVVLEEAKQNEEETSATESSLVFVGSRSAGKTTLVTGWTEQKVPIKPTVALDYCFRYETTSKSFKKSGVDIAHVWELRGGTGFCNLLEIAITPKALSGGLSVIFMVDLSLPQRLWATLETLHAEVRGIINRVFEKDAGLKEKILATALQRVGAEHVDHALLDVFPVPLLILGGQYDVFAEKFEPEKKKIVCRTLRNLAHLWGATLQFTSKDGMLLRKAKDSLTSLAFQKVTADNIANAPTVVQDYNRPLYIPVGSDSFATIAGVSADEGSNTSSTGINPALWREALHSYFPQEPPETYEIPADPASNEKFQEPEIDALRAQKQMELESHQKAVEAEEKTARQNQ